MKRSLSLLVVSIAFAAGAVGSPSSCASAQAAVGCVRVDVSFSNLGSDPPITVNNFSFELPSLSAGAYTQNPGTGCSAPCVPGTFPDWVGTPQLGDFVGVFYPTTAYVSPGSSPSGTDVPDGVQVAYISTGGGVGTISQDVNTVIEANTTYTLSVSLGARVDGVPLPASYGIELFNPNTSTVFAPSACAAPGPGAFVNCTITFDSSVLVSSVGQELGILLFANDVSSGEVLFDNVQLGFQTNTPEPSSIALVLLGLAALACMRRIATALRDH